MSGDSDTLDGPLKEKLIDNRYRVLEKLGEGGMGAVYKVEHVRMGKLAAIKLMRPDHALDKALKARFLQEARVVARLSPAVLQSFGPHEVPSTTGTSSTSPVTVQRGTLQGSSLGGGGISRCRQPLRLEHASSVQTFASSQPRNEPWH